MHIFQRNLHIYIIINFARITSSKKRPAVVIATLHGDDFICCQITSEARFDDYSIVLKNSDFNKDGLKQQSTIRPNKMFTADQSIILYKVGTLKVSKLAEVKQTIVKILTA